MELFEIKKLKLAIHPLFISLFLVVVLLGHIKEFLIVMIIVTIHEMSHIITALYFGAKFDKLIIYPLGELAVLSGLHIIKSLDKFFILLAGPMVNLFLGIMFLKSSDNEIFEFLALSNFAIGIFNMFPIYPLDGGKILQLFLSNTIGIIKGNELVIKISRFFIHVLMFIGMIQLICYPYNMSILLLSLYLKSRIKKEEFNMNIDFFKDIFSKEEFILKNKGISTEIITVMEDTTIQEILKQMKSERLYRINVVDEQLNFVGEIAENQLMDIITEYGIKEKIRYILSFQ